MCKLLSAFLITAFGILMVSQANAENKLIYSISNKANNLIVVEPSRDLPLCATWLPPYTTPINPGDTNTSSSITFNGCPGTVAGTFLIHDAGGYNKCDVKVTCDAVAGTCTQTLKNESSKMTCTPGGSNKNLSIVVSGSW